MTLFSFVIPSFNSGSDILECVKSLAALEYDKSKYEIVVVDDGSTDSSVSRLIRLKVRNLKIFSIFNQGAPTARNFGIANAKGETLILLDQDVVVAENLLKVYERTFKNVDADVVQGNIWEQIINTDLTRAHAKWRRVAFINKVGDKNGFIKTIVTRNVAIKKDVLDKIEQKDSFVFNETFKGTGGEDRELGYRIKKMGFKIYFEPEAIVRHKDPDKLSDILFQKYKHAQGDVRMGIGERLLDLNNFNRAVVMPVREGVPLFLAFLLRLFHIIGGEVQKLKLVLDNINTFIYYKIKRLIDIFGSLIGLIVGSSVLLLISLLIKLDSEGPVIFKQKRVSIGWKEFEMFKFRTMVINAEEILKNNPELLEIYKKSNYKIKEDPRVTRVGKILRKFSLDELPQLINILKGEMSIVGPRAYKKDEVKNQLKIHPELNRYAVTIIGTRPGLTGLWQVSGRSEIGFEKRFAMDYSYAKRRNIFFDILLIFKTIPAVLKSRGAW